MTGAAQVWGLEFHWTSHFQDCFRVPRTRPGSSCEGTRSDHTWRGRWRGNCAIVHRYVRADVRAALARGTSTVTVTQSVLCHHGTPSIDDSGHGGPEQRLSVDRAVQLSSARCSAAQPAPQREYEQLYALSELSRLYKNILLRYRGLLITSAHSLF